MIAKPLRGALIFSLTGLFAASAAAAQPAPQTARQALLEMLFSKTPGTFEKHLPQVTRAALHKAGTTSGTPLLAGFSALTSQLSHGQQLQTFEAGPTLLSFEDPQARSKFEVTVERDDLRGEEDEIELSFRSFKDGATQTAGAKFRLTLAMKQEAGTWCLNEVSAAVGVSLTDPEFLKGVAAKLTPATTGVGVQPIAGGLPPMTAMSGMTVANEASAAGALRTLNAAEVTYVASFPGRGFTCELSDLGGMGAGGEPTEHQAMLIDPRLASGKKNGYIFALSGCDGTPASRYSVIAMPADPASGTRAFCSDESAVIRFSAAGKAASCGSLGQPLR